MLQPTLGKPVSPPPPPQEVLQTEPVPVAQPPPAVKTIPAIEDTAPVPLVRCAINHIKPKLFSETIILSETI